MPPGLQSRRALTLLLIFAIGGVGTPLAHQFDHLIERLAGGAPAEVVASVPDDRGDLHDCELCEVRLAAIDFSSPEHASGEVVAPHEVPAPQVVPHSPVRPFDGRAPPTLA